MKASTAGTTGRNAGLVVPQLKERSVTVRALVRDGGKADLARRAGAEETALDDLRDNAGLRAAAGGVDGIIRIDRRHGTAGAGRRPRGIPRAPP